MFQKVPVDITPIRQIRVMGMRTYIVQVVRWKRTSDAARMFGFDSNSVPFSQIKNHLFA
jgi:hypothetical protein